MNLKFFQVNKASLHQAGLYINWANTSLFIILGALSPFVKVAIFSDVILVSNFHG